MARLFWAALLGAGAILEVIALRHQRKEPRRFKIPTLSTTCRWLFRTDTREGRLAFLAFWGGLSAWFVPHIVRTATEAVAAQLDIDN